MVHSFISNPIFRHMGQTSSIPEFTLESTRTWRYGFWKFNGEPTGILVRILVMACSRRPTYEVAVAARSVGIGCLLQLMSGRHMFITWSPDKLWHDHEYGWYCSSLYPIKYRNIKKNSRLDHYELVFRIGSRGLSPAGMCRSVGNQSHITTGTWFPNTNHWA